MSVRDGKAGRPRALAAVAVVVLSATAACTNPSTSTTARDLCVRAIGSTETAAPTTVGAVRSLRLGHANPNTRQLPLTVPSAFPGDPTDAPAAWCWKKIVDGTYESYAADENGNKVYLSTLIYQDGPPSQPPTGAPGP
jgi:hypothetical protein